MFNIKAIIIFLSIFVLIIFSCNKDDDIIIHYDYQQDELTERETEFLLLLNQYRTNELLPDLRAGKLANEHNVYQIANDTVSHEGCSYRRMILTSYGAFKVNEITGRGYSSGASIFNAFLNSEEHYKIINDKVFNACGIDATADDEGHYYYTIIFIQI